MRLLTQIANETDRGETTMIGPKMQGKRRGAGKLMIAVLVAAGTLSLASYAESQSPSAEEPVSSQVPLTAIVSSLSGVVYGGQRPVAQASLALYASSTSGYNASNKNLLKTAVSTDPNGKFSLSGDYTCTAGQQIYIVATGGNPGPGKNANLSLMAALGECTTISKQTVTINEVSTVASVFALAPFMSSATNVSTSGTNMLGLTHAFASVRKLANLTTGASTGTTLPAGAVAPSSTVNTLANLVASCVNSNGVSGNPKGACAKLFSLTTPASQIAPANTIQALLNIAHYPTLNVLQLYEAAPSTGPFQPVLASTKIPKDWTLAVTYSGGGLKTPKSTAVDAAGNIWITNAGSNTVTVVAQNGTPVSGSPFKGNGLAGPTAIAIDSAGNGWVANTGGKTVSAFRVTGVPLAGSPFSGGGNLSAPNAIAIDAPGDIWVANSAGNSVTKLSGSGAYLEQVSSGVKSPTGLAINPK